MLAPNVNVPTCVMGDLNGVMEEEDRVNCLHSALDTNIFNSFITNNGLISMKTQYPHYTWFGPANKKSKLDWILVNHTWLDAHNWTTKLLHRKNSDHRPIWIGAGNTNWGPKPFKLFNSWLLDPTLIEMLQT